MKDSFPIVCQELICPLNTTSANVLVLSKATRETSENRGEISNFCKHGWNVPVLRSWIQQQPVACEGKDLMTILPESSYGGWWR